MTSNTYGIREKYLVLNDKVDETMVSYELGSEYALVITGIIYKQGEKNVTIETIRFYRRMYPNITIILSSWRGEEDNELLRACKDNNVCLLLNDEPVNKGSSGHCNCQIMSARYGIEEAYKKECKWVFKTRTDQRFYKSYFLEYFTDLETMFPTDNNNMAYRFIVLGTYNSFKYYPFYLSDFMVYGDVKDVLKLYDGQLECGEVAYHKEHFSEFLEIVKIISQKEKALSIPNFLYDINFENKIYKQLPPECFLYKSFYDRHVGKYEVGIYRLIEKYHLFLKKYCIVIDDNQLLFDWPHDENVGNSVMTEQNRVGKLDFAYWLKLYNS